MAKNRIKQRQNRLLFSEVDRPLSIEEIESRFERLLEKKLEEKLMSKNEFDVPDPTPREASEKLYVHGNMVHGISTVVLNLSLLFILKKSRPNSSLAWW